jgi:hypothetical protein
VYETLAEMADCSIRRVRGFVAECSQRSENMAREMRSGLPAQPMNLVLTFDVDSAAMARFSAALHAIDPRR